MSSLQLLSTAGRTAAATALKFDIRSHIHLAFIIHFRANLKLFAFHCIALSTMVEMKSQKACTHKFKYKTALCKNFESFGCCQYGDQCNYAHGFAELRGKTLGERQVCGMVGGDVMTFRTRPCFDHVSTGSW